VKIVEQDLERAVLKAGLSREQAQLIWQQLQNRSEVEGRFEPAHVGYYFGALLVIGAMGWFMTNGWDAFTGWQLSQSRLAMLQCLPWWDASFGLSRCFESPLAC
jgi:hypothetical protein